MALSWEQYKKQNAPQQQASTPAASSSSNNIPNNPLYDAIKKSTQAKSGIKSSWDEYKKTYDTHVSNGYTPEEAAEITRTQFLDSAVKTTNAPTPQNNTPASSSFLNEALGNTNTEESYLDKVARDLYNGKKGLGEKLIRAGAQVASFANTAKAGVARGLGNVLEDTADAAITALTGLNKKETSAYQIANGIERVPNAASINDKNIYKGVGKTSYTQAEWDSISAQDKKRLSRMGINSLDEFNTSLASANEKMGARKTAHGLNETQGLGAKLNEKAMEWQEKAGEHAYVSTYGLGDEWGDGRLEKMALELIPSLAGMMTDGAISMVTGVPSLGVMSVRTFLDSYNNAMSKGVSEDKANVYALAHSAVETLSEMIGGEGAVGLLYGAGLTDKAFEKAIGKIGNKTLQKIAYLVGSGASEGIEEVFSQISEPFTESILETDWGKSVKKLWGEQKFRDYMDAFLGGFLSSAVATGATNLTSGAVNAAYGNGFTTATDMQLAGINQEFGKPAVQLETAQQAQQTPAQSIPSQASPDVVQMLQNELNSYANGDNEVRTQKSREAYNRYATNVLSRAYTDSVLTDGDGNTFARVISADSNGYVIAVKTANGESPVIIPIVNNGNDGFFDILTDGGTNLQNYFEQGFTFVDSAEIEAINNEKAAQQNAADQAEYIAEQNEAQQPVYNPEDMNDALNEVSMQMDEEQRNDYLDALATSEEPARPRASQYFEPIIEQTVAKSTPQKQPQNAPQNAPVAAPKNAQETTQESAEMANDEFNTKPNSPRSIVVKYYTDVYGSNPKTAEGNADNFINHTIQMALKRKKFVVSDVLQSEKALWRRDEYLKMANEYLQAFGYQIDLNSGISHRSENVPGIEYDIVPLKDNADSNTLKQPTEDAKPKYKKLTDEKISDELSQNQTQNESEARKTVNDWLFTLGIVGNANSRVSRDKLLDAVLGIAEDTGRNNAYEVYSGIDGEALDAMQEKSESGKKDRSSSDNVSKERPYVLQLEDEYGSLKQRIKETRDHIKFIKDNYDIDVSSVEEAAELRQAENKLQDLEKKFNKTKQKLAEKGVDVLAFDEYDDARKTAVNSSRVEQIRSKMARIIDLFNMSRGKDKLPLTREQIRNSMREYNDLYKKLTEELDKEPERPISQNTELDFSPEDKTDILNAIGILDQKDSLNIETVGRKENSSYYEEENLDETGSLADERKRADWSSNDIRRYNLENSFEDHDFREDDWIKKNEKEISNQYKPSVGKDERIGVYDKNSPNNNSYIRNAWKTNIDGKTYYYAKRNPVTGEMNYHNILKSDIIDKVKSFYRFVEKHRQHLNEINQRIDKILERYSEDVEREGFYEKSFELENSGIANSYDSEIRKLMQERFAEEKLLDKLDDGDYTLGKVFNDKNIPIELKMSLAGIDKQYDGTTLKGIRDAISEEYVRKAVKGETTNANDIGVSGIPSGDTGVYELSDSEKTRRAENSGIQGAESLVSDEYAETDAKLDADKYGLTRTERAELLESLKDADRIKFAKVFGSRFIREQFDAFKSGEFQIDTDKDGNVTYAGARRTKAEGNSKISRKEAEPAYKENSRANDNKRIRAENEAKHQVYFHSRVKEVLDRATSLFEAIKTLSKDKDGKNTSYIYQGKNSSTGFVVRDEYYLDKSSPLKGTERVVQKMGLRPDLHVIMGDAIFHFTQDKNELSASMIGGNTFSLNGDTFIFAKDELNVAHESRHDDCEFASISEAYSIEHKETFEEYLETNLRRSFSEIEEDYDAFKNFVSKLYSEDEIPEELFSELAAVLYTDSDSEWDSDTANFTSCGKKLANSETFNKLVKDIERYYEDGYTNNSDLDSESPKFKKLDSDTAPHGGLSVNGAETQFKQLDGVTQKASNAFEAAAKRIEKSRSAYDKNEEFVAFKDSITKVMSGETSFADFYKSYKGLEKSNTMKAYHDRTVDGMLEMTQHLREKAEKEPTAQNIAAFQEQAATAMQALAHRVDTVNVTVKDDLSQATKLAMKNGKVDPKDKSVKTFIKNLGNRLQLLDQTMFKSWGGFDEKSRNVFYRLASEAERAHANEAKNRVQLKSFFNEIGKDKSKAMRDLLSGNAKTGITVNTENGPYELSWLDAMSLADSIETHGLKESASITSVVFTNAGDKNSKGSKLKFEEGESIIDLYNQVKKAMDGNNEVRTLKAAATEMFADAWPKLAEAYKRNTGVELGKRESYFPLAWASEKAGEKPDDFVRSLDTAALHRRTRTEEGSLLVRPYAEVIDKYIGSVSNYMAYSELGTKLEIMQNGALGVDGLSSTLKGTFGEQAGKWYDEYTRVINNYEAEEDMYGLNKFARKLRSNFAQGSLLFSVSTPAKQITALPTIQGVVSPMAMRQAMLYQKKAGYNFKEHAKANPLYAALRMGGIDPDIAAFMNSDALTKASRKSGVVATMANLNAIVDAKDAELIFKACALDVKMNNPNVKVGSELFNTLVENKFQEAVVNINPVYNTKARAEMGRTNNELVRFMTMFRTQQTQMYNRLATSIGEYKAAVKNGNESDIKAKKETLTQTVKGQAEAAMLMAAVQFAVDMMLHKRRKYDSDDDDEPDAEGILKRAFIETTKSLSDVVLGGQQIAEYALDMFFANDEYSKESSGFSLGPIDTIGKFLKSIQTLRLDFTRDEIEKGTYGNAVSDARYVLTNGATLLGVPANSIYNIANSIIMAAKDLSGNNDSRYDDMAKALDAARKDFGNKLFSAYLDSNKAKANKYIDLAGDRLTTHLNNTVLAQVKKGDYTDETLTGYLLSYGDYDDEADAMAAIRKVHLEADTGIKYNNIAKEYKDGNITKEQALAYWQAYGGLSEAEAQKKLRSADYNKNTGLKYENLYSDFVKGKITEADYRAELEKANANDVLDPTAEIDTKIAEARYEKMTGVHYETIGEDYRSGKITADQLVNARMAIKGETRDEAKLYLETQNFKKKFNVNYTDMKKLYRQGKISPADAITWRMKAGGASQTSAGSWVKAQDIFLDTGYEPDGKYISTYYDSYATSATIGTNTFYDKYINEFSSHKGFGKVFNALNDPAQSAKSEYATNHGALSPKQTGVIDILNENIADGTISYSLAKKIWTEYCGYKASSQAFRFVG